MYTTTETATIFCMDRHKPELADLAERINAAAKDAFESSHDAVRSAIAAGGHLTKAKTRIMHGRWGLWLAENFKFSQSTANNFMRLHKHRHELLPLMEDDHDHIMDVTYCLRLIGKNPSPEKTIVQIVEQRCNALTSVIFDLKPADAKAVRELIVELRSDLNDFLQDTK